jgi:hypothetical protein
MSDPSPAVAATTPVAGPDPLVSLAFAMGWQMADLYRNAGQTEGKPPDKNDLPGAGSLELKKRIALGIDQIQVGLHRLSARLTDGEAMAPSLTDVRVAFAKKYPGEEFKQELYRFHESLIAVLTAADFMLGKAYGLGRALSDTVHVEDYDQLDRRWNEHRLRTVVGWLADLDSAFPPHSARAVMLCLEHWELWLAPRGRNKALLWNEPPKATWTDLGNTVRRRLLGQGRRWRALLSGEKQGTDMLSTDDYVNAAGRALNNARGLAGHVLWKFRELVVLIVALLVLGAVLALSSDETAKILAGAGAVLSGLGISWKTIGTSFTSVAEHLREPVWGSEVDQAIADAVTLLPGDVLDPRSRKRRITDRLTESLTKKGRKRREKRLEERREDAELGRKYSPAGPGEAELEAA